MNEIGQLAAVLRNNGDQVLNSISKLSLSANLLNNLNESFQHIIEQRESLSSTFQVVSNSNTKIELYRDLQFLHDFIQRTSGLKLLQSSVSKPFTDIVDISKFKNLKLLEVNKVHICLIRGIQVLRGQIQYLICLRSLNTLQELLIQCGADNSQGFVWSELKEATFSYNHIEALDNSFECTPWIHTLDLSHNDIKDIRPLECLHNLKHLNLAFNKIESIPTFSSQLNTKLQVLVLSNNCIEDIRGLTPFTNLCELDLSSNCLMEHNSLIPITHLAALQFFNLQGNPLSFHPKHRSFTCTYLHTNTSSVRFILDRITLTKKEQSLIGTMKPKQNVERFDSIVSSSSCEIAMSASMERPRKVRHAVIAEDGQISNDMEESIASVNSLIFPGEHLETKRQIEQLRQQYGETWLKNQAGTMVQDALGLQRAIPASSTPYSSTPIDLDINALPKDFLDNINISKPDEVSEQSTNNVYMTASDSTLSEDSVYAGEKVKSNEISSEEEDEGDDILGEGEENLYLATIPETSETVFVIVSDTHLWERECTSSKEKARWGLDILLSCERIKSEPPTVQLEFETLRRDRQKRVYELEQDEAVRFIQVLNKVLSVRPINQNHKIFRCMKCSAQFSVEIGLYKKADSVSACPTCSSTLIIEEDGEILKT